MSRQDQPTVFLSAAEDSSDMHAANLIAALAERRPEVRFFGVGGPRMVEAGCELLADITAHASMFLDNLTKVPYYHSIIRRMGAEMSRRRAAVLVPTDSPGLNWHMAAAARRIGVPVMYYIAPQVWAWAPWRVKKVRRLTDHVACILPFEEEYFRSRGIRTTYVGHPMFDHLPARPAARASPPGDGAWRILLLPGSRVKEIHRHGAAMVRTAELVGRRYPKADFTFSVVNERSARLLVKWAGSSLPIVIGQTHRLLAESHVALATSGTVTLESAYFGVPMVTFYRIRRLSNAVLSWWLMNTRFYSLVNILAGRELVPELIPWFGRPELLADAMIAQLDDPDGLIATSRALIKLTEPLKAPLGKSASAAAADLVIQTMRRV